MNLSEILNGINVLNNTSTDVEVKNVCFDSRKVTKGDVFVATRGTAVDGHDFIAKAVELGAVAVVCETLPEKRSENVVYVQVDDSADALGIMA